MTAYGPPIPALTIPRSALQTVDDVLPLLHGVQRSGRGYVALCPAHEDAVPSLSIREGDTKPLLLKCHRGCSFESIIAALLDPTLAPNTEGHLEPTPHRERVAHDLVEVTAYSYHDSKGRFVYQAVRLVDPEGRKTFRMRRPYGAGWIWGLPAEEPHYLYRLHALIQSGSRVVYIVEGEKDVEAMWARGLPAVCNVGGAGKWLADYTHQLVDAGVTQAIILPDNDDAGAKHAALVSGALVAAGITVKVVPLPVPARGDVSDYFEAGHTVAELLALVEKVGHE